MNKRSICLVVVGVALAIILVVTLMNRSARFNASDPNRVRALREVAGTKVARDAALRSIDHEDSDVRGLAVLMLGRDGNRADIPVVLQASEDSNQRVRALASSSLIRFDVREATEVVCNMAVNDSSAHVRQAALRSLAGSEEPIARVTLVTALDYATEPGDRQAAADAIVKNFRMRMTPKIENETDWERFVESAKHIDEVREAYAEMAIPLVDDPALWEQMKADHAKLCHTGHDFAVHKVGHEATGRELDPHHDHNHDHDHDHDSEQEDQP